MANFFHHSVYKLQQFCTSVCALLTAVSSSVSCQCIFWNICSDVTRRNNGNMYSMIRHFSTQWIAKALQSMFRGTICNIHNNDNILPSLVQLVCISSYWHQVMLSHGMQLQQRQHSFSVETDMSVWGRLGRMASTFSEMMHRLRTNEERNQRGNG